MSDIEAKLAELKKRDEERYRSEVVTKDNEERTWKAFKEASAANGEMMAQLTKRAKDAERVCSYTQGTHTAFLRLISHVEVVLRHLIMTTNNRRRELELRVAELENRPAMKYVGVWRPSEVYVRGDFATLGGSLWHCQRTTNDRPGDGNDSWVLAVKRGKDAR